MKRAEDRQRTCTCRHCRAHKSRWTGRARMSRAEAAVIDAALARQTSANLKEFALDHVLGRVHDPRPDLSA